MSGTGIALHASKAGHWLACSRRAQHEAANPQGFDPKEMKVGTLMGHLVHQKVTGHEFDYPERIVYDQTTRTEKEMKAQLSVIVGEVLHEMSKRGYQVLHNEHHSTVAANVGDTRVKVEGTLDMVVANQDGERYIIDLKTGVYKPASAMLQVALYSWAWTNTEPEQPLTGGGVLWAKRMRLDKCGGKIPISVMIQPLPSLMETAGEIIKYMAGIAEHGTAPSPDTAKCSTCGLARTCSVSARHWDKTEV